MKVMQKCPTCGKDFFSEQREFSWPEGDKGPTGSVRIEDCPKCKVVKECTFKLQRRDPSEMMSFASDKILYRIGNLVYFHAVEIKWDSSETRDAYYRFRKELEEK